MRLLNVHTLEFGEHQPNNIPRYAIASHRWFGDAEASLKDVQKKCNTETAGYKKVQGFADYVKDHVPHVDWLWIDTCCINQKHGPELSEAINSMFKWYSNADVCLVYLRDVEAADNLEQFKNSEWFQRGWTLQELVAPWTVVFLTNKWEVIGHKGKTGRGKSGIELCSGPSLTPSIVAASGIPEHVLNDFKQSRGYSTEERLNWANGRRTTREEDMWYCLLGMFDVSMPVIYGEGAEHAKRRFLEEVSKAERGYEQLSPSSRASVRAQRGPSCNIPFRRDPDFVERGTLLDDMQKKLGGCAGRVALVGLGGAGKSQLAIEYAHRLQERSPATWVFWIFAGNAPRFEQGMRDLADLAKIDKRNDSGANLLRLIRNWLRDSIHGHWTVILDNVDDSSFLIEPADARQKLQEIDNGNEALFDYLPVCDHGSILITSRSEPAALRLVDRSDLLVVSPMTQEDALELLEKKFGPGEDKMSVVELAAALEHMPLAMTQAAAYIKQRGRRCSIRKYLEKLQKSDKSKQSILDHDAEDVRRDRQARNSILLTWQISFEHIREIRPTAAELLSLMSFCDRQAIPESLIRRRRKEDEASTPNASESTDEDRADGASDSTLEVYSDEGFDDDLTLLQGYSFVSVTADVTVFEMHRIVQLATREWLQSQGELEKWKEKYIENLCVLFPDPQYENWAVCQKFYPHARLAVDMKPEGRHSLLQWASLMYNAAWYARQKGSMYDAEKMTIQSMEVRMKQLGAEHYDTLESATILASTYLNQGRWTEAEKLQIQVLATCKKTLGVEHLDTLIITSNLALTYSNQGRYIEAEELNIQVLETRKNTLGIEHPDTLTGMNNLALTYANQGRYTEAEKLQIQVLEAYKKTLGMEHPDMLISMNNLALTYTNQGRYAEAEELETQAFDTRRRVIGAEHPTTLRSMNNLASIYADQGRYAEAEKLQIQVLDTRRRVIGTEHPDTLRSMEDLAHTLKAREDHESASVLMKDCTEISLRVLGGQNPFTMRRVSKLNDWEQSEKSETTASERETSM